jgi:hypothetical protein
MQMRNDPESLERDNDAAIGHMSDRVAMLRSITDNIHDEAESHKKLLDGKFLFIFVRAISLTSCFVYRDGRLHGRRRGDFRGDGETLQRGVREQQERTAVLLRGVGDGGCHLVPPLPQRWMIDVCETLINSISILRWRRRSGGVVRGRERHPAFVS